MIRIGTNIAALRAGRLLAESSAELGRSFERLSSGLRINRASDDAAGLSISESLRADRRLYGTAQRNISDAVSVLSIADSVLGEQANTLSRLAELAEQAANGTFSTEQRRTLQKEYEQLIDEYGRLGDSAQFNGLALLRANDTGAPDAFSFQLGIRGNASSRLSMNGINSGSLSGSIRYEDMVTADLSGDGGVDGDDAGSIVEVRTLDELADLFGGNLMTTTVYDTNGNERTLAFGFIRGMFSEGSIDIISFISTGGADTEFSVTQNGLAAFNNYWDAGGDYSDAIQYDAATGTINSTDASVTISGASFATWSGGAGLSSSMTLNLSGLRIGNVAPATDAIDFTGVETASRALTALDVVRNRIESLAALRGTIGATQSRLETALGLVANAGLEVESAGSRIRDADIASESSKMLRLQILQQAGAAVLAQANTQPALALQLLGT